MIKLNSISKTYNGVSYILKGLNLEIKKGEYVQIVGKSGSGKSTLLNLIGLLDTKCQGEMLIDGKSVLKMSDNKLSEFRSEYIGFIFQAYHLINHMTVMENVMLPILYSKKKCGTGYLEHIEELINQLGLTHLKNRQIQFLSGGEKQRVSIARALSLDPKIVLADEPTGNLDKENSEIVFKVLKELSQKGKSVVLVTHNWYEDSGADRILNLQEGKLD